MPEIWDFFGQNVWAIFVPVAALISLGAVVVDKIRNR